MKFRRKGAMRRESYEKILETDSGVSAGSTEYGSALYVFSENRILREVGMTYIEITSSLIFLGLLFVVKDQEDLDRQEFRTALLLAVVPAVAAFFMEWSWGSQAVPGIVSGIRIWGNNLVILLIFRLKRNADRLKKGDILRCVLLFLGISVVFGAVDGFLIQMLPRYAVSVCYYLILRRRGAWYDQIEKQRENAG